MSAPAVLTVKGVTKRYGNLLAVNNLYFKVNQQEVLGLIGPNGSGKTTVINLISGALQPTSGEILLGSKIISVLSAQQIARQGISRTFQLVKSLPSLSVVDQVIASGLLGLKKTWSDELRKEAFNLLDKVGLSHLALKQSNELTSINLRRLELAQALVGDPVLILMDEWLAGLNPSEVQIAVELIRGLREEGRSVILIEHAISTVRSLCDRCVVMNSGIKIADGEVRAVLRDPEVVHVYQ
jgi:branched-chain amino acid transport system ATP-binding protein